MRQTPHQARANDGKDRRGTRRGRSFSFSAPRGIGSARRCAATAQGWSERGDSRPETLAVEPSATSTHTSARRGARRLPLLLAAALLACRQSPTDADQLAATPGAWQVTEGTGVHLESDPAGGLWRLDVPAVGRGSVGYVMAAYRGGVPSSITATFAVECSTDAAFVAPGDTVPATVGLMVQRRGDDLAGPFGRWWAPGTRRNLAPGVFTVSAPLDWRAWTSVWGQQDERAFARDVAAIGSVGLTFGGQSFYGHGAAMAAGHARFRLVAMDVTP